MSESMRLYVRAWVCIYSMCVGQEVGGGWLGEQTRDYHPGDPFSCPVRGSQLF